MLCKVDGSIFGLDIGFGEVFAVDAEGEKLEAAEEENQNDNGCVTRGGNAEGELLDYNGDDVDKSAERGEAADPGGNF